MDIFNIYTAIIKKNVPFYGYIRNCDEEADFIEWIIGTLFEWV